MVMKRTKLSRRALLLLTPLVFLPARATVGQQGHSFNNAEQLNSTRRALPLIDQLRMGLRCNTSSQVAFLEVVVQKVEQGQFTQSMVNVVYKWAIGRNEKYPFPYFQLAMRDLAKRRGISL
jgi:hypothetical protein